MVCRNVLQGLALAAMLVMAGASHAADWPQWRGPARDNVSKETGLLKEWPTDGPKLVWKTTGIGSGYSGVSVVGGKIYTMGDKDGASQVFAIGAEKGDILWSAKVGKAGAATRGNGFPGPRCTPTVDGDMVYALNQFGDLVCLKLADGKEVWRKNLYTDFGGKIGSMWDYSESPLVDGGNVVCTPGGAQGSVVALNKKTGELVWRAKEVTDDADYSSLVPVEFGGVRQYIQLSPKSVYAVAADSGKLLWIAARQAQRGAMINTPIFKDGIVYVSSSYNVGCNAYQLTAENGKFKAAQIYANKDMAVQHGGVVLVGDYVYGYSDIGNKLRCMELKTGKVMWENPSVGKCAVSAVDGDLIVRSEKDGTVALVEAKSEGYKEKGRFAQPDRSRNNIWPHPVVSDGKLYLRDQNLLLSYELKK